MFSPSRQHVGYPFLFAPAHHPALYTGVHENEKYRKLMLKKQKRSVEVALKLLVLVS